MKSTKGFLAFALVGMTGGCAFDGGTAGGDPDALDSASQALTHWIGPITDDSGFNIGHCGFREGVTAAQCVGAKCDDNYLQCATLPILTFGSADYYTRYISEEGPNNEVLCDPNGGFGPATGIIVGMRSTGPYSDNISLICQGVIDFVSNPRTLGNCQWTSYFSEEQPAYHWRFGSYATGLRCKGSHCDQVSYQFCDIL